MSSIGAFQLPGQAADAWINALVERQVDPASHPELATLGYINASGFSWNKGDLTSLPDIIESAQTCGAITGPAGLWCQLRLHPATAAPLLRVGINVGEHAVTNEQEISFEHTMVKASGPRAKGTWVLVWTVAMILGEANTLWRRYHGQPEDAQAQDATRELPKADPDSSAELRRWTAHAVRALVEVRAGRRPTGQLRALASQRALADITRWSGSTQSVMTIASLHISQPAPSVAEVVAILRCEGRGRAVALRLDNQTGTWQITNIASDQPRGT